jgi:hypothetical protein
MKHEMNLSLQICLNHGVFYEGLKFCLTRKKNINIAAVCFHYVQRNSKLSGVATMEENLSVFGVISVLKFV